MEKTKSFEELIVWQKAHQFVLSVYEVTKFFPKEEQFGLSSQFRRASVSIASNIAEGYSKRGIKDKLRFFNISQGSASECRYYLRLTKDLKFADVTQLEIDLEVNFSMLTHAEHQEM
ncbi:MAG: four helix bundle protein [Flammeovirgaceae bacterium]|nr:MAG: four helix bundle protein [Flammeovirgaceae bacterium]